MFNAQRHGTDPHKGVGRSPSFNSRRRKRGMEGGIKIKRNAQKGSLEPKWHSEKQSSMGERGKLTPSGSGRSGETLKLRKEPHSPRTGAKPHLERATTKAPEGCQFLGALARGRRPSTVPGDPKMFQRTFSKKVLLTSMPSLA